MALSHGQWGTLGRMSLAACLLCGVLIRAEAQTPDDNRLWTTVGSGGTVDEADTRKIFFNHGIVQIGRPIAPPHAAGAARKSAPGVVQSESAVIRYNVTPVDGLFAPPVPFPSSRGTQLRLRYLATGPSAQIIAQLIEVDLAIGSETVRLTFKSTDFPGATGYHVNEKGACDNRGFDFINKAYYVEVTLTHSALVAGSAAGVQIIKIGNSICQG
jgi:hypothetical protein